MKSKPTFYYPVTYYDRPSRCWFGFWQDKEGSQLGNAVHAHSKDAVLEYMKLDHQQKEA